MSAPAIQPESQGNKLYLHATGDWRLTQLDAQPPQLAKTPQAETTCLDGAGITSLDTSGALTLLNLLSAQQIPLDSLVLANFSPQHQTIFELVRQHFSASQQQQPASHHRLLVRLGSSASLTWKHLAGMVNFIGILTAEVANLIRHPQNFRSKELANQLEIIFVYAIPLAFSMMFLLGLVFAYLLGIQAEQYGANIFVVDGSALAICRELAPVIVAILVAGRSGAAITAQIGTMKVYEEIDAIRVLGLSPYAVLVLPRIMALLIALPLLVFVGDIAGLFGSMVIADQQLSVTPITFINRLDQVLATKTVVIGLVKAPVFAVFIGIIASYMGFTVARDARSIGFNTTSTVVQSIVAVILLNAIFAIILVKLNL
ncbi:MlaE family ABC transporter permease [Sulfuriferula thiophila]|uniref:MlaE family ABC transporter permease n=1 Tax=Sulfuriferula thiophila TaxID=1781211 RepID=UPI000F606DB7|nr:ABC transporter permease [Sulfuriferula thiophila]